MTISAKLKAARARLGLTQAEAAKVVGVSPRTLWQWESGRPLSITPEQALRKLQKRKPNTKVRDAAPAQPPQERFSND